MLVASALLGLGVGAAFAAMAALIADNVDPREMGVAGGVAAAIAVSIGTRPVRRRLAAAEVRS